MFTALPQKVWTTPKHYAGYDPVGEYCIITVTRDSGLLDESNWHCVKADLLQVAERAGVPESVYTWRASHWACGWVEYLMVKPDAPQAVLQKADEILNALADYPVYNEEDWSDREYNAIDQYWRECSLSERIQLCTWSNASIFAARHSYYPEEVFDHIRDIVSN